MKLSDFSYSLPDELIARYPSAERTASRLLQLDGASGEIQHRQFSDLLQFLRAGDLLVLNDTRVIPARLWARKPSGGQLEILLERVLDERRFIAQVRASKALTVGGECLVCAEKGDQPHSEAPQLVMRQRHGAMFEFELNGTQPLLAMLQQFGHMPLPPYIDRNDEKLDQERYQTVFARREGAVAAPTAGLHFSEDFLQQCRDMGVETGHLTLHVGAGTFQPVRVDDVRQHQMHSEWIEVSAALCQQVAATRARGGRVVAVGTTVVRSLETASATGQLQPFSGDSDIFIYPGYRFHSVDALITNFHLPQSTLIMLVSAFAGREQVLMAYAEAVAQRYRFFSYGDAMLVLPRPDALAIPDKETV